VIALLRIATAAGAVVLWRAAPAAVAGAR
jgi:hypothetical protein